MSETSKFSDLSIRILSGLVLVGVALAAIFSIKLYFILFCMALAGICVWEVGSFSNKPKRNAVPSAIMAALLVGALHFWFPVTIIGCAVMLCILYFLYSAERDWFIRLVYIVLIIVGCWGILMWREEGGVILLLWLVGCVVGSDIGGYFFGRIFGGPKLWPAVSPKKTWSGTIGGWVLAMVFSLCLFLAYDGNLWLIALSVPIAIAAQAGDLFESWIKRRADIKDSSSLIPGHGGFLDRFDGFIGAGCLIALFIALRPIWIGS